MRSLFYRLFSPAIINFEQNACIFLSKYIQWSTLPGRTLHFYIHMLKREKNENELYRAAVRQRIASEDGSLFQNSNAERTQIIVSEFLDAATISAFILCGSLNKAVYEPLVERFEDALNRGVDVRVIVLCEEGAVQSKTLAKLLKQRSALKFLPKIDMEIPHFAVFDGGLRYRIEQDPINKWAIVCACSKNNQNNYTIARGLEDVHSSLWNNYS